MNTNSEKMLQALSDEDLSQAQIFLEKALTEDPADILAELGEELLAIGFLIEAKQIFEQLINQYPENDGLNIPLAEIAIEDNEIDLAFEYLEKVDLHKELQESCERLSGGEKQRLCLARVMLMDAEVYLVDEPSSALDKETESFVIENLVHFVTERKRQLIMVTHSAEVSAKYPKSLLRIENGDTRGYVYE